MKEFSLKMIEKAKSIINEKLDYTPISIPFGDEIPRTHHESIARILLASGQIGFNEYLKMVGIHYDYDENEADDDYDDDYDDLEFIDLDTDYTRESTIEPSRSSEKISDEPSTSPAGEVVPETNVTSQTPSTTEAS